MKNKSRRKAKVVSSDGALGVEKTLKNLIDKFLVDVAWEFKDFKSYRQRLSYWKKELGDLPLEEPRFTEAEGLIARIIFGFGALNTH